MSKEEEEDHPTDSTAIAAGVAASTSTINIKASTSTINSLDRLVEEAPDLETLKSLLSCGMSFTRRVLRRIHEYETKGGRPDDDDGRTKARQEEEEGARSTTNLSSATGEEGKEEDTKKDDMILPESVALSMLEHDPCAVVIGAAHRTEVFMQLPSFANTILCYWDLMMPLLQKQQQEVRLLTLQLRNKSTRDSTNRRRRHRFEGEGNTTNDPVTTTSSSSSDDPNNNTDGSGVTVSNGNASVNYDNGINNIKQEEVDDKSAVTSNQDIMVGENHGDQHQEENQMGEQQHKNGNRQPENVVKKEMMEPDQREGEAHRTQMMVMVEEQPKDILGKQQGEEVVAQKKSTGQHDDEGKVEARDAAKKEDDNFTTAAGHLPTTEMNLPLVGVGPNAIPSQKKKKKNHMSTKEEFSLGSLAVHVVGKAIDPNEPRQTRRQSGNKRQDSPSTAATITSGRTDELDTTRALKRIRIENNTVEGDRGSQQLSTDGVVPNATDLTTGQQAQAGLFIPLLHCEQCKAVERAKQNKSNSLPCNAHHPMCTNKKKRGRPPKNSKQCDTSCTHVLANTAEAAQKKVASLPPPPPQLEEAIRIEPDGSPTYDFCGVCTNFHIYNPANDDKSCEPYYLSCDTCKGWYLVTEKCTGFSEGQAEDLPWNCFQCVPSDDDDDDDGRNFDGDYCEDDDDPAAPSKPTTKAKSSRSKRPPKDPDAPKDTRSSYIFFNKEMRSKVAQENPGMDQKQLNKKLGALWRNLSPLQKKPYEDKAAEDRVRHKREMDQYEKIKANAKAKSESNSNAPVAPQAGPVTASRSEHDNHVPATVNNSSAEVLAKRKANEGVKASPSAFVLMEGSDAKAKSREKTQNRAQASVCGGFTGKDANKPSTKALLVTSPALVPSQSETSLDTLLQAPLCSSNGSKLKQPLRMLAAGVVSTHTGPPRKGAGINPTSKGTPGQWAAVETTVPSTPADDTRAATTSNPPDEVIDLCSDDEQED